MGLQGEGQSFLDYVCGEKSVLFDYPRQRLYLGNIQDLLPSTTKRISLYKPDSGTAFIVGRVTSVQVDGTTLPANVTPRFAIFDTGTTQTIVSPDLLQALQGKRTVNISFEAPTGTVIVPFTIPPGSVEVGHLPFSSSMLIGNRWLRQYAVGFRHQIDEIVFF
jgi:hypothetical protein